MIVLFFLFATARAVTINSPAKWNIVDGVIPQGLDAEKGCPTGLRLSETKPVPSIPISCANIRYSVYDSSVATMGYDEVTIDRSYTERNVVSEDGVCKMQMSSMDSSTSADVYTKGQDMKFFSRYGYCDGTYTGTKHFTETTFVSDRSCQEGPKAVQRININYSNNRFSIFGTQNPELKLTKGVNYEFYLNTIWDTFTITSDGNEIGTRLGQLLSINHADFVGDLRYNGEQSWNVGEITMENPTGYPFAIYTEEECALYTGNATGGKCDDGFVNHRCSGHGVCDNEDCTEFTCSAPYTGDLCNVIGDMTQPFGCWSDGTFNAFNRGEHLDVHLDSEVQAAKYIRKQELLVEWGNLSTILSEYTNDETVPDFVTETIDVHSIEFLDRYNPYENYVYQETVVRAHLQNIAEQINSAWAKFKYLRDLNAQLDALDNKLLNLKADVIAYKETVEKLKLYGVTDTDVTHITSLFDDGINTRNIMEGKVASLNFDSEVSALTNLFNNDVVESYINAFKVAKSYDLYSWCQASRNHRLYTTLLGYTGINNCFPSDKDGLACDTNYYDFRGQNVSAPCGGGTLNYGFPEYSDDDYYESALVKLGLNLEFVVHSATTSFKYLGRRVPEESEKMNSGGNYQDRYIGIHHMRDFRSIYKALQNITSDWKNLHEMGDYAISHAVAAETLEQVDPEKRVEARELSLSNIQARETAIACGVLNGNPTGLGLDPLYESLVKLNHKCENCACYKMTYNPNNDKPDAIRADCKEQCVGHDGFLLYWDTSKPRVDSQRDRHRSSCICAGDGEPISELECVLANREWISNTRIDQYELTPKDPTVKTGVQTKDVYLHCPGPMCSDGPSVGCWHWDFEDCNIGRYCSKVFATVTANFYHWSGNQHIWHSNDQQIGTMPYRLNKDTLVFGGTLKLDETYKDGGYTSAGISIGMRAYYDYRYVGVATDLYGNVKETRTKTGTEVRSIYGIDNIDRSIGFWNSMDIFDDVYLSNFNAQIPLDRKGMWCSGKFVDSQCLTNQCNFGFVEEICACGNTTCVPGQYCTKDGDCKDVTKKEKKFLHLRYNSLE